MPVRLTNSNSSPMSTQGAFVQIGPLPQIIRGNTATQGSSPTDVTAPVQVIGLVPVFACCNGKDATAQLFYIDCPNSQIGTNTTIFDLSIDNIDYGTFSSDVTMTNLQIQILIDLLLTGSGFTVVVSGSTIRVITVYAPSGSEASLNGLPCSLTWVSGCGKIVNAGGITINPLFVELQCLFTYTDCATPQVSTYSVNINGHGYGQFASVATDSDATIQTNINSLLTGSPYSAVVVTIGGIRNVTFTCADASYNGEPVIITNLIGCGQGNSNTVLVSIFKGGTSGVECDPNCDCRQGLYKADSIADDHDFILPVFASTTCDDPYENDFNSFLFQYTGTYNPLTNSDFKLLQEVNGQFVQVALLFDATYGVPIFKACQATYNYAGYAIMWQNVLKLLGPGVYKFEISKQNSYCFKSPPFCLQEYTCQEANSTVRFESDYTGGNFGSVTTQGIQWSLCCCTTTGGSGGPGSSSSNVTCGPITWHDSIRFAGFFGYETVEYQRDFIKYATGVINKVRDEAIKSFTVKTDRLPMWFHERFYAYGLMADQLYVSDYNINNANYNYKHFWVVADSGYSPKYTNYSRYTKILDLKFKEGQQFVFRDRCCGTGSNSGGGTHGTIGPGEIINTDTRQWADLDGHNWSDGQVADWA